MSHQADNKRKPKGSWEVRKTTSGESKTRGPEQKKEGT